MSMKNKRLKKILLRIGLPIITVALLLKGLPSIKNLQIASSTTNFLKQNTISVQPELSTKLNLVSANVQNGRSGFVESVSKIFNIFQGCEGDNIYCLQESTENYVAVLLEHLGEEYVSNGDYRLGNIDYEFNEGNPIITNAVVKDSITFRLSFVPDNFIDLGISIKDFSIMPRIAVLTILENEQSECFLCLNTHLDYNIPSLQVIQLKQIYTILSAIPTEYPIIIAGDFNIEPTDKKFIDFKNKLEMLGIVETLNSIDTFKGNENVSSKRIDYVFSRGVNLESEIIFTTSEESDHNFILVKTK